MTIVNSQIYNGHNIATAFHEAGNKDVIIFCHGFRGSSIGPKRFFIKTAMKLAEQGVSSLRFDQYGSGNSDGDFFESSFNDWVSTTKAIAESFLRKGYRVGLFGQSMGGATVIAVASELPDLTALVAWAPDPNVEPFEWPKEGYLEEGGQRVQARYWQEAHEAKVAEKLRGVKSPAYIIQCSNDEYVDENNQKALAENAQSNHLIVTMDGYTHSGWSFEQAEGVIAESVQFLLKSFN